MISLEESFVSLSWSSSVLLILDCFIKTLSLLLGLSILLSSSAVFIYSLYTIQSPNTMLESSLLLDRFVLYLVSVSFILFLISLNNQFILHSPQKDPFLKIPQSNSLSIPHSNEDFLITTKQSFFDIEKNRETLDNTKDKERYTIKTLQRIIYLLMILIMHNFSISIFQILSQIQKWNNKVLEMNIFPTIFINSR